VLNAAHTPFVLWNNHGMPYLQTEIDRDSSQTYKLNKCVNLTSNWDPKLKKSITKRWFVKGRLYFCGCSAVWLIEGGSGWREPLRVSKALWSLVTLGLSILEKPSGTEYQFAESNLKRNCDQCLGGESLSISPWRQGIMNSCHKWRKQCVPSRESMLWTQQIVWR
jgi:hypothetical protein